MTMRRIICLCLAVFLCVPLFSSCEDAEDAVPDQPEEEKILVGFSLATLKEDRWLRDRDIFIAKARQEGLEVIAKNANNDSDIQYEQVLELLDAGIDILVIAANDCTDAARCVNAAKETNVPVISYDRLILKSNVDAYISFDNIKVGQLMGSFLSESVPAGGYIILNGSSDDSNSAMFNEGYMSVLEPLALKGNINILAETWVKDWTRELAFEFVSDVIKEHRDEVSAVLCANDSLAWGAIDALSEARMIDSVQVVGHDADLVACQRIVDGTQLMTVYKPISNLVSMTVDVCVKLVGDEKLEPGRTIDDGLYDVPYFMIDVIPVTKDNIDDTVIKDGFHLAEDIYRPSDSE
jgi:D-xylose transport system substrate-binding protein